MPLAFVYKNNPRDQACTPTGREWWQSNEGLAYGCSMKESKVGTKQAKFVVAISYKRGVILCEQYTGRMSG